MKEIVYMKVLHVGRPIRSDTHCNNQHYLFDISLFTTVYNSRYGRSYITENGHLKTKEFAPR